MRWSRPIRLRNMSSAPPLGKLRKAPRCTARPRPARSALESESEARPNGGASPETPDLEDDLHQALNLPGMRSLCSRRPPLAPRSSGMEDLGSGPIDIGIRAGGGLPLGC